MGKVYILNSCSTCKRIVKEVQEYGKFEIVDIKKNPLQLNEIDRLAKMAGSYEAIFNKQSKKYREKGLAHIELSEEDYRQYLSEEYTFLKRPVFVIDNRVFAGNSNKSVSNLTNYLSLKLKKN